MKLKLKSIWAIAVIGLLSAPIAANDYQRTEFGHGWKDLDQDCLDTRNEILIRDSVDQVELSYSGCDVKRGRWVLPFSGQVVTNPHYIDIDHIVPLKWAWDNGANNWTRGERVKFANDQTNLIVTSPSVNRSKGSRSPFEWMPPLEESHCFYLGTWQQIVKKYDLTTTNFDRQKFKRLIVKSGCR